MNKKAFWVIISSFSILLVISILITYQLVIKKQEVLQPKELPLSIKDEKIVIPGYPGSTLVSSTTDPQEGTKYIGKRFTANWLSDASVRDVTEWYTEKYKSEGWKYDFGPTNKNADIQLISFYNDKYTLYVSISKDPDSKKTKIVTEYETKHPDTFEIGENKEEETEEQLNKKGATLTVTETPSE